MGIMNKILESLPWPLVIEQAVTAARQILDSVVNGEELGPKSIRYIRSTYNVAKEWLDEPVLLSETQLDDRALNEFFKLAEDTFEEAGKSLVIDFTVPTKESLGKKEVKKEE